MLTYSQCKYLNCLMPYPYMWKQYVNCKRNAFHRKRKLRTYNCSRIPNCPISGPNK